MPRRARRKVPHFLRDSTGAGLAFAGLYELWRDPARSPGDPDRWWWSAVIITTQAPDALGWIHDRTPEVVVPDDLRDDWLDPDLTDPAPVPPPPRRGRRTPPGTGRGQHRREQRPHQHPRPDPARHRRRVAGGGVGGTPQTAVRVSVRA